MKLKKIIFALMFTSFVFGGGAEPFGMKPGMKIEEIDKKAKKIGEGVYLVKPEKTHKYFESYKVWVDKKIGLYQLEAKGFYIPSKSNGNEVKKAFKNVYNQLKNSYGKETKKVNYINEDSYLKEKSDFLRSLKEGDRKVYAKWKINKKTKSNILLSLKSNSSYTGYLILQYQFKNYKRVLKLKAAEIEKAKRDIQKDKLKKEYKNKSIF